MSFGEEREYAGNLGYADELSKAYQYDSCVQNHRQILEGDLALLRGKNQLFGVARIERIKASKGEKRLHRCPVCLTTNFSERKNKQPKFRCIKGGHEFNEPDQEDVACKLFTAHFGDSFVPAKGAISLERLRDACPKFNKQMAMQSLDFGRIEAILIERVPDVQQLLATHGISEYLESDDAAELVEITGKSIETMYSPIPGDRRQVVMHQIRARRGQHQFRQALRMRYGDKCMITGCQLLGIIEAAHISPYRGNGDNHPQNGLLLRADLHTLFDLDLLGINPESLQVQFHPAALATGYDSWGGKTLLYSEAQPSQAALESRWRRFQIRLQSTE